jgi:formate hydrogenlyase subunit 3/multisubunit Na+/H+ antiporter MnhD subunit
MPQEIVSYLPLIAVLIPLAAFILITCAPNLPWWRSAWSVAGSLGALIAVGMMYPILSAGNIIVFQLPMIVTPLDLTFRVDFFRFLLLS